MEDPELGPSAYVVLGLTLQHGEITPYELKQRIATSVGYFWSYSHPQIYAVARKLAAAGYLDERQEETGRRRKVYQATESGRDAFRTWVNSSSDNMTELRDLAILKLYFGKFANASAIRALAAQQVELHKARLETYAAIPQTRSLDEFALKTVDLGVRFEQVISQFWQDVEKEFS